MVVDETSASVNITWEAGVRGNAVRDEVEMRDGVGVRGERR